MVAYPDQEKTGFIIKHMTNPTENGPLPKNTIKVHDMPMNSARTDANHHTEIDKSTKLELAMLDKLILKRRYIYDLQNNEASITKIMFRVPSID